MAREPTPPPLDAPYDSITSPHLRSVMFEKLDKDRFVKSYIQSQKPHAIIYAADGKAIQSSWDDQLATTADRQNIQTRVVRDYGFDTPVLQPRVVRLPDAPPDSIEVARDGSENEDEDEAGLAQEVSSKKLTRRTNKKSTGKVKGLSVSSGQKENVALPLNKTQAKLVSKKHPLDADPDSDQDDHVARLTERRERKRAKRAIVQPKELSASEAGDTSEDDTAEDPPLPGLKSKSKAAPNKTGKAKKDKKSKVPTGLALLYGFSSKNVGKNRLTLNPEPTMGVFGKGKASANAQVTAKASKKGPLVLQKIADLTFLHGQETTKKKIKRPPPSESASQSEESSASLPTPVLQVFKAKHRLSPKARTQSKRARLQRTSPSPVNVKATSAARSEIWDLELSDHSCSSALSIASKLQEGTVVLDTRAAWGAHRTISENKVLPDHDTSSCDLSAEKPMLGHSSSLCPSESASQYGQPRVLHTRRTPPPNHPTISKYYAGCDALAEFKDRLEFSREATAQNFKNNYCSTTLSDNVFLETDQNDVTSFPTYPVPAPDVKPTSSVDSIEKELQAYADADANCAGQKMYAARPVFDDKREEARAPIHAPVMMDNLLCINGATTASKPASSVSSIDIELHASTDYARQGLHVVQPIFNHERKESSYATLMEDNFFDAGYGSYNDERIPLSASAQFWEAYGFEHAGELWYSQSLQPNSIEYDGLIMEDGWNDLVGSRVASDCDFFEEEVEFQCEDEDVFYVTENSGYRSGYLSPNECGAAADRFSDTESAVNMIASDIGHGDVSVAQIPQFLQGRAILLGLEATDIGRKELQTSIATVAHAELAVAKSLREHWRPQKF